jgi:hypothetical protein
LERRDSGFIYGFSQRCHCIKRGRCLSYPDSYPKRFANGSYRDCQGRQYTRPRVVCSPDLKAFLSATPFFGGLSDASLDLLISMLVERRFEIGATVVAEGEPGLNVHCLPGSGRN